MEPLCNFCEDTAVLYCHDCNMHFCIANGCDEQIHAGKRHKKEGIQGLASAPVPLEEEAPLCEFCELSASEVYCEDCCMYLCTANGCLASVHKNAIGHEITSLFVEDGDFVEYVEEDQEGPSDLRSQSRDSIVTSQEGPTDETEPELSQLSIHSGGAQEDKAIKSGSEKTPEKVPEKTSEKTPEKTPEKPAESAKAIKVDPPKPATKVAASADLPRSLTSPLTAKSSSVKLAPKGATPAPATAAPRGRTGASQIVSNVVKRLVAPIKGTGTKEERLQRREAVLAARADPKLPYNTFGSKFAPEDAKGRRAPSLTFLKPAPRDSKDNGKPPVPRAPSPAKPSKTPSGKKDDAGVASNTPRSPVKTHTPRALPPSWSVTDKNASPAAALPSSLFSASSALPSPTASTARARPSLPSQSSQTRTLPSSLPSQSSARTLPSSSQPSQPSRTPSQPSLPSQASSRALPTPSPAPRGSLSRGSLSAPAQPRSSTSSSSAASASTATPKALPSTAPRRASTIQAPAADTFEYPAGLAPLGLKYVNAPEAGVLIRGVTAGEAGDRSGIQLGDTIKLLNRKAVRNVDEFQSILLDCKAGVPYKIAVVRQDKSVDLKLTL